MTGGYSESRQYVSQIVDRLGRIETQLAPVSEKLWLPFETTASKVPVEVIELAHPGNTLEAVKRYRELTNAGAEEAKAIVRSI